MDKKPLITHQENELIDRLVNELDAAQAALFNAQLAAETQQALGTAEFDALREAYEKAQVELAKHIQSLWHTGYRLCMHD